MEIAQIMMAKEKAVEFQQQLLVDILPKRYTSSPLLYGPILRHRYYPIDEGNLYEDVAVIQHQEGKEVSPLCTSSTNDV
jgi:hypothetical protein